MENLEGRTKQEDTADNSSAEYQRQSGEALEKEMKASIRPQGSNAGEIRKASQDLDELARQGYTEVKYKSPVVQAAAKFYLTLRDEGASEIMEKQQKAFDEQIRKYEALRDDYERDIDKLNVKADSIYSEIADLGDRIKQRHDGLDYLKLKLGDMDRLIAAKRESAGAAESAELKVLASDYGKKPVQTMMRERRDLETVILRAEETLEPLYADVMNKNIEYDDAEQGRKMLLNEKRHASSDITDLYKQKTRINSGLLSIVKRHMQTAELAEESARMARSGQALSDAVRQYMRDNFDQLFVRYEIGVPDRRAGNRAEQELDEKIEKLSEDSAIHSESNRAEALAILNKFGIYCG